MSTYEGRKKTILQTKIVVATQRSFFYSITVDVVWHFFIWFARPDATQNDGPPPAGWAPAEAAGREQEKDGKRAQGARQVRRN